MKLIVKLIVNFLLLGNVFVVGESITKIVQGEAGGPNGPAAVVLGGFSNLNQWEQSSAVELLMNVTETTPVSELIAIQKEMFARHSYYTWTVVRTYSHLIPFRKYYIRYLEHTGTSLKILMYAMNYENLREL